MARLDSERVKRIAKVELETTGYTVVQTDDSYAWQLVAVNESQPTEPIICITVKRANTIRGAKLLMARYQRPNLPSGFQAYKHQVWVWVDRKGWLHDIEAGEHGTTLVPSN